nr:uncharacterized protein LOC111413524 [Onthophagus taurus]
MLIKMRMLSKMLNLLIIFILVISPKIDGKSKIQLYINEIKTCPGFSKAPIQLKSVKIINDAHKNFLVSYRVDVTRNISEDANLRLSLERCASKEAPDTCTKFTSLYTKNACKLCNAANTFFAPFVSCLKPPLNCPIIKRTFRGENCTFNMDLFRMFPITGFHWKFKFELFHSITNECIFCCQGEAGIYNLYIN